jgi:hypothetical protein
MILFFIGKKILFEPLGDDFLLREFLFEFLLFFEKELDLLVLFTLHIRKNVTIMFLYSSALSSKSTIISSYLASNCFSIVLF